MLPSRGACTNGCYGYFEKVTGNCQVICKVVDKESDLKKSIYRNGALWDTWKNMENMKHMENP